jgi:hypothetical protein
MSHQKTVVARGKYLQDGSIFYQGERYEWQPKREMKGPKRRPQSTRYGIVGVHFQGNGGTCCDCAAESAFIIDEFEDGEYTYRNFELCEHCLAALEKEEDETIKWADDRTCCIM